MMNFKKYKSMMVALILSLLMPFAIANERQPSRDTVNPLSGDPQYTAEYPSGFAMVGDLLIARPLLIAATAIGTAAFVITLPFTALGGNVGAAGEALVVEPGKAAFVRCLGCTESGYKKD